MAPYRISNFLLYQTVAALPTTEKKFSVLTASAFISHEKGNSARKLLTCQYFKNRNKYLCFKGQLTGFQTFTVCSVMT